MKKESALWPTTSYVRFVTKQATQSELSVCGTTDLSHRVQISAWPCLESVSTFTSTRFLPRA